MISVTLHQATPYDERGPAVIQQSKYKRTWRMIRELRQLGYRIDRILNPAKHRRSDFRAWLTEKWVLVRNRALEPKETSTARIDKNVTSSSDNRHSGQHVLYFGRAQGIKNMETVSLDSRALMELQAEIFELEETILDRATRDRLLDMPKRLFTEAQKYLRKGNVVEARLTLNSTFRLVERAKRELQEVELTTTCSNSSSSLAS